MLFKPFTSELDLLILVGSSQLRILCGFTHTHVRRWMHRWNKMLLDWVFQKKLFLFCWVAAGGSCFFELVIGLWIQTWKVHGFALFTDSLAIMDSVPRESMEKGMANLMSLPWGQITRAWLVQHCWGWCQEGTYNRAWAQPRVCPSCWSRVNLCILHGWAPPGAPLYRN